MMMLRATLLALALLSASAFELVSQTFKGDFKLDFSDPSVPVHTTATVEFDLDMESVKFRSSQRLVLEEPHLSTTREASMIFDAEAKRATFYTMEITASSPMHPPPATCYYIEFPDLPAPAVVAKCLQDFAALAKPMGSEDGLQKVQIQIPFATAEEVVYFDESFVVKNIIADAVYTDESFVVKNITADANVPSPDPMTFHAEMTDMSSEAGAPDSSVFVVPMAWGTCIKDTMPPISTVNNAVMKRFLHCTGMGDSQASIMV